MIADWAIRRESESFCEGQTESEEHSRFKDLLRRLVAVPKKEADDKMAELHEQRSGEKPGHKL